MNKKGMALLAVLVVLLVVVALANVMLSIMLNQSRLTHHNVSRIRAYYAAMAGIRLAYENLRTKSWAYSSSYCINPTNAACNSLPLLNKVSDPAIPYEVMITIGNAPPGGGGPGGTTPISATANYLYQQ